ncbi:MAG: MFS transporter [Nitrospirota bacterium]
MKYLNNIYGNPTMSAIIAEGFLTRLGFGMVGFALPLFAMHLGMNLAEVGMLYVLRTVSVLMVKPVMGWAADRFGAKHTLVFAVIMRCLVGFLFIFAALPWHLYAIRILSGAITAARDPSASSLIAEHGDKKNMASTFAWYVTAREIGKSLGYGLCGLLITAMGGYRLVFIIAFITSLTALITVIRYVRKDIKEKTEYEADAPIASKEEIQPPDYRMRLLHYAGFGLMITLIADMMRGFFPIIAIQYAHLSEAEAGIAASASSIFVLIGGPLFGWLSDNVSRKLALGTRSFANIFSSLLYIFFPSFSGFLMARVIDDTGKAAFRPAWGSMLAELSENQPSRRGRTLSYVDSASTLGEMIGPMIAGLLLAGFGIPAMLGVRAALSVIVELQAIYVTKR